MNEKKAWESYLSKGAGHDDYTDYNFLKQYRVRGARIYIIVKHNDTTKSVSLRFHSNKGENQGIANNLYKQYYYQLVEDIQKQVPNKKVDYSPIESKTVHPYFQEISINFTKQEEIDKLILKMAQCWGNLIQQENADI